MWDNFCKKIMDEIVVRLDMNNKEKYPAKLIRGVKFFGYKGIPFLLTVFSLIALEWIMFRVYAHVGFDKTVIVILALILFSIRTIKIST